MTFLIKNLTIKNFLSVGNVTQAVNFDRHDLTLVLGDNMDLGGDGKRNGVGKTSIINALSYALYGSALSNIKKENLINKTNAKNMLVTVEFEKDSVNYRIERGRKPNITRFWVGNTEQDITNDAQGDSRETQAEIERMLGMSHEMFKHILALNTYTEPFLNLRAHEQRDIIEQLLGITVLSEKAEKLKEQNKITKDMILGEEYRITAVTDANTRITEQIDSLKRRQTLWTIKHVEDTAKLQSAIDELLRVDIDTEIIRHNERAVYFQKKKDIADLNAALNREEQSLDRENKSIEKMSAEINTIAYCKCHSCGQDIPTNTHTALMETKIALLHEAALNVVHHEKTIVELNDMLSNLGLVGDEPSTFYNEEKDAIHHRAAVTNLQQQLASNALVVDPYAEQIEEMTYKALEVIDYNIINDLVRLREHQDFLLKLLTNKDSFIRKRIIDQNLTYLNARLEQYLTSIGLPHTVKFLSDLTVSITDYGRDFDFDSLSRGERQRLIISMSFAFRDVFESLYSSINLLFIDELIDSGLDQSGVDDALAILKQMARTNNKSVWIVSHRDELISRVSRVMRVTKSNGFTEFSNEIDTK